MDYSMLPGSVRSCIAGQNCFKDDIGRSDSEVLIFPDKVLKIRKRTEETENELAMLTWLQGRVNVPGVIAHEAVGGTDYLLMSRVEGRMTCDPELMADPEKLTKALADVLLELWRVDISDCPVHWPLDRKLDCAAKAVKMGSVDIEGAEPETFGDDAFQNPEDLLNWLIAHRPDEDFVLSHGDFCLPNVFVREGKLSGLIDLGRAGVADRWQDIALCYRSLKHNYGGKYGGKVYPDYNPDRLFHFLGIHPDWDKLHYYILLDELF